MGHLAGAIIGLEVLDIIHQESVHRATLRGAAGGTRVKARHLRRPKPPSSVCLGEFAKMMPVHHVLGAKHPSRSGYSCDTNAASVAVSSGTARAPMIQVRWASDDLTLLQTHPLTPGLTLNTALPTLAPTTYLLPAASSMAVAQFQNQVLQNQVGQWKVAMGLVAGLLLPLLLGILVFMCITIRRLRKTLALKKRNDSLENVPNPPYVEDGMASIELGALPTRADQQPPAYSRAPP